MTTNHVDHGHDVPPGAPIRISVHTQETHDLDAESCLFEHLADDRIFRALSEFDKPSGRGQLPLPRFEGATNQHDLSAMNHHRVDD